MNRQLRCKLAAVLTENQSFAVLRAIVNCAFRQRVNRGGDGPSPLPGATGDGPSPHRAISSIRGRVEYIRPKVCYWAAAIAVGLGIAVRVQAVSTIQFTATSYTTNET